TGESVQQIGDVFNSVYGMEFVNAKRVLKSKYKRKNRDGMSLADRIKHGRGGSGAETYDGSNGERNDSAFASVDIADFANLDENERRTPTPEPTVSQRQPTARTQASPKKQSPKTPRQLSDEMEGTPRRSRNRVTRQESKHSLSATPPLPPIKPATPRQERRPQEWTDDLKNVPVFSQADIFVYLLSKSEWSQDDGGCKHVVALLFSLAQWSERHTDRNTETCTDRRCVWDVPRKVSMPKLLDEIELSSNRSRVLPLESMYDPTVKQSNSEIEKMVFNLVADTDAQILEVLDTDETNVNDTILQTNVPETLKDFMVNFKQGELLSVFGYLSSCTSEIYCTEINKLTVDQSESSEWYKYRHGRITSSIMHNACHYKGSDPDNYVVKQIMNTEQSSLSTPAVLYGKEREPLARSIYEKMYMNEHKSSRVALSGLIINASYPHLGASPDGVVQCKCCGLGILEIKCPYKFKTIHLIRFVKKSIIFRKMKMVV
ncbi:hypothetical protein FSP39_023075, partial [Pinctada imbricata]